MAIRSCLYIVILLVAFQSTIIKANDVLPLSRCRPLVASSLSKIEFALNLIIYKAELFLRSSIGLGINDISPGLVKGPEPIGATVANLDNDTCRMIEEFGLASVGHIKAIINTTSMKAPIEMPQLDMSAQVYANFVNAALNVSKLRHPYNAYANTNSFLFAAVYASSFLQQYYAGIISSIVGSTLQELVVGMALYEGSVFGALRSLLNDRRNLTVPPNTFTVADLTNLTAQLANRLAGCGVKDEGLIVPLELGAENRTTNNVVQAGVNSLASSRTERELLRIVFADGNATKPGGIFPGGFIGIIFRQILLFRLS